MINLRGVSTNSEANSPELPRLGSLQTSNLAVNSSIQLQKLSVKRTMVVLLSIFSSCLSSAGQSDSATIDTPPDITWTGFVDVFHAVDLNYPNTGSRLPFLYNHNRHNEINLNLGIVSLMVRHKSYRGNIALHAGTYVVDNYANEPLGLSQVNEGNVGVSLDRENSLWLDAGIFGSHIGFESAISKNSWTLTRSLLAENSPYFLAGAKVTYLPVEKWEVMFMVCNGWQRIRKVGGNSLLSFGTQIKFTDGEKLECNWSTFVGTDDPDSLRRMRYFNNFYVKGQISAKVGVIVGFDIGFQQTAIGSTEFHRWMSPVAILRYLLSERWSVSARAEYYHDRNQVIVKTATANGFQTSGFSINVDYSPQKSVLCRVEGRLMHSVNKIFPRQHSNVNDNVAIVSSIALSL